MVLPRLITASLAAAAVVSIAVRFVPHPKTVLVVGDSISSMTIADGALPAALEATGRPFRIVGSGKTSDAFPGFTAGTLRTLFVYTKQPSADIILVQAGTNDLFLWRNAKTAANQVKALLQVLRSQNPRALILVAPIPPMRRPIQPLTDQLNSHVAADIATAADPNEKYIGDFPSGVMDKVPYTPDGVHPLEAGRQIIAQRWAGALSKEPPNTRAREY